MKSKDKQIELPFEISTLANDLKEIKQHLQEAVDDNADLPEEVELLLGVVDNLEEMIKNAKDPKNIDQRTKISLIAHFSLFQDLIGMLQSDEDFDDEDLEDEDSEVEDEESEVEDEEENEK